MRTDKMITKGKIRYDFFFIKFSHYRKYLGTSLGFMWIFGLNEHVLSRVRTIPLVPKISEIHQRNAVTGENKKKRKRQYSSLSLSHFKLLLQENLQRWIMKSSVFLKIA